MFKPGDGRAFATAMSAATPLISATPGFIRLEIRDCVENPGQFLLLVWWETLEAHTQGFRGSSRYVDWKRLLHHFYDPFPIVEHYGDPVVQAGASI